MITKKKEYSRLPGRGLKLRTRAGLYIGKDHLLCLYNTGYAEDYKRFYYKDIQAIVTCKTERGKVWNIMFGIFAIIFALLSFTVNDIWRTIFLLITGFFLLFLIINWLQGPTCISRLYTSVTKEELPSLGRLKNAMKVMDRLRPIIENAQGKLTSEEIRVYAKRSH
jgi:hypothetical protein